MKLKGEKMKYLGLKSKSGDGLANANNQRLIGIEEVLRVTNLSRPTIWRLRRSKKFPQGVQIDGARRIVWLESDVQNWITKLSAGGDK